MSFFLSLKIAWFLRFVVNIFIWHEIRLTIGRQMGYCSELRLRRRNFNWSSCNNKSILCIFPGFQWSKKESAGYISIFFETFDIHETYKNKEQKWKDQEEEVEWSIPIKSILILDFLWQIKTKLYRTIWMYNFFNPKQKTCLFKCNVKET